MNGKSNPSESPSSVPSTIVSNPSKKTSSLSPDDFTDDQINDILQQGDVGTLEPKQRSKFLYRLAEKLRLNPFSRPFDLIHVKKPDGSKKLIIYANKGCADQIRERDQLDIVPVYAGPLMIGDVPDDTTYVFHVRVTDPKTKRVGFNVGAVPLAGTSGEDRANAIMKAWTKAERRATLAFAGLGFPDESEVSGIKGVVEDGGEGKPKMVAPQATARVSAPLPRATAQPKVTVRP